MQRILLAVFIALAPGALQAGQISAYEALRSVGREKGDGVLARLVELRGADGNPQPQQWTLVFSDAAARGGTREFVVSSKGVIGERSPLQSGGSTAGGAIAASALKLDSTGAFDAANRQAAKARVGFQSINYQLNNRRNAPVWCVRLFDVEGAEVGMMEISAKDASVVTPWRAPSPARTPALLPRGAAPAAATAANVLPADGSARPLGERWVEGGGLVGHVSRWGDRTWQSTTNGAVRAWQSTGNAATRVGDSVKSFFVGRPQSAEPAR